MAWPLKLLVAAVFCTGMVAPRAVQGDAEQGVLMQNAYRRKEMISFVRATMIDATR